MSNTPRNLVVLITHGIDHELSSVALTRSSRLRP